MGRGTRFLANSVFSQVYGGVTQYSDFGFDVGIRAGVVGHGGGNIFDSKGGHACVLQFAVFLAGRPIFEMGFVYPMGMVA